MAKTPDIDEEKRSYGALFLLSSALLLVGAVWAVTDDLIIRRPWKKYQAEFGWSQIATIEAAIAAEEERLAQDPGYQELTAQLAAAREAITSGARARAVAELEGALAVATVRRGEADQDLRFVKSGLEEARYEYDHALAEGHSTAAAEARIAALDEHKARATAAFDAAAAEVERLEQQIAELHAEVRRLEDALAAKRTDLDALHQKLDGVTAVNLAVDLPVLRPIALRAPLVPNIKQVVLPEFDRSEFDTPLARVDRCESCHIAIDRPGFEEQANPLRTHPQRDMLLGRHPVEKFGCTPCHGGQGPAVNSPAMAHGDIHFWDDPLHRGEKVEANCIKCHVDVQALPAATTIARGEQLFEQLGCHGCHLVEGYEGLAKVGPSLRRVGAKVDPGWLVRWIENPHAFRPRTKMPNFLLSADEATSVAAYLLDATRPDSEAWLAAHPAPPDLATDGAAAPELIARGRELVESIGCRGCHALAPDAVAGAVGENKDVAPNLSAIAAKTGPRWMYHWIKNPRGYSPVARMPSLRLSDEEARAITAYLATLGTRPEPDATLLAHLAEPDRVDVGKRLVRKYGCFGCHDIPGMENESRIGVELTLFGSKTREELFFGDRTDIPETWDDWTYHKLENPRVYQTRWIEQLMPNFELAEADIRALRVFLASRTDAKVPPRYVAAAGGRAQQIVAGRRLVMHYNCVGCHVIEGRGGVIRAFYEEQPTLAPPNLHGEGEKVQPAWLYAFLKVPVPIRPWLQVRMPTFGVDDEEAHRLVDYFGALDRLEIPFVYVNEAAIPPAHIAAGRALMSTDYFACFSCHQQGERKPEGPPEGWAPDLTLARDRLNPEWIVTWLRDPQKVMPGTKMPSFYPGGPEDILGGDEEQQLLALRDYILTLGRPEAAIAQR